jgi:hypothetical protein
MKIHLSSALRPHGLEGIKTLDVRNVCRHFGLQKTSNLLIEVSSIDLRSGSLGLPDRAATWAEQSAEH